MANNNCDAKSYKYTKNDFFITKEQRDFYEKNGYIIIRKLVNDEVLEECKQRFLDICNGKADQKPLVVMRDISLKSKNVKGEYLINKIQDFADDEVFFKYISYKPMVNIISSIIGPNITVCHSMLINKPPDADQNTSRHPLHQDLHYMPFRPENSIVASWTAMEQVDEKNGCLFVIPGSHKGVLERHDYLSCEKNKAYYEVLGFDHLPRVNLVMEKGDTVFFHPVLLHGSGPNLTKGFRKAISGFYADSNCNFIDVRGTSQENLENEIYKMFKSMSELKFKLKDVWKMKSRLVQGSPGNFQKFDSHL